MRDKFKNLEPEDLEPVNQEPEILPNDGVYIDDANLELDVLTTHELVVELVSRSNQAQIKIIKKLIQLYTEDQFNARG